MQYEGIFGCILKRHSGVDCRVGGSCEITPFLCTTIRVPLSFRTDKGCSMYVLYTFLVQLEGAAMEYALCMYTYCITGISLLGIMGRIDSFQWENWAVDTSLYPQRCNCTCNCAVQYVYTVIVKPASSPVLPVLPVFPVLQRACVGAAPCPIIALLIYHTLSFPLFPYQSISRF